MFVGREVEDSSNILLCIVEISFEASNDFSNALGD